MATPELRPAYKVTELSGNVSVRKARVTAKQNAKGKMIQTIDYKIEEEAAGFLVTFPRGHSIRVKNVEALRQLGYDARPWMVPPDDTDIADEEVSAALGTPTRKGRSAAPRREKEEIE